MNLSNSNAADVGDMARLPKTWSIRIRIAVSMLLLFHLAAVIVAPCTTPPPRSELAFQISRLFEPYLSAMYLFHGYRFFAPNPGPGHLVRYETIDDETGEILHDGRFPDFEQHWPRLLYHRYFMIAERIWGESNINPPLQGFVSEQQREDFENYRDQQIERLEPMLLSVARHLQRRHDGNIVRLYAVEHIIPPPQDIDQGLRLDDPQLYQERLLGELSNEGVWIWPVETTNVPSVYHLP